MLSLTLHYFIHRKKDKKTLIELRISIPLVFPLCWQLEANTVNALYGLTDYGLKRNAYDVMFYE